jgi:acyl transferase domain-containing protein
LKTVAKYIYNQVAAKQLSLDDAVTMLKELQDLASNSGNEIAIIGMACRFPKAANPDEFWDNLINKINCIDDFPPGRNKDYRDLSDKSLMARMLGGNPREHEAQGNGFYGKGGYLNEIDKFDATFFNIAPKEAIFMDPLQRIFLETAYEAMEDSGYGGQKLYGARVGVFVGDDHTFATMYQYVTEPDEMHLTGSWAGILASRISYIYNFQGPSLVIDTACSSGLVGIHEACRSLKNKECEVAIAGGIYVRLFPNIKNAMGMVESSDDCVRTFDKDASGTVWGEGAGALVLKPLNKAIADHDHIYAVIKGSAINNDGASNGITAPNAEAQKELIIRAWKDAKIDPETISYIEAHGTGTKLGDPIEIKGIQSAFEEFTTKKQFCGIGSVKTNVGHLVAASGLASVIKVVLALKNKKIPPSLHFNSPNSYINFLNSPVYVNDCPREWNAADGSPRRAGVSAFGFSGTNCHLILEEAPGLAKKETGPPQNQPGILTISARNQNVLKEFLKRYDSFLDQAAETDFGNICYSANTGRGHYNFRIAFMATNLQDLKQKIAAVSRMDFEKIREPGIYFGTFRIVPDNKTPNRAANEFTEQERRELNAIAAQKLNEYLTASGGANIPPESAAELCRMYAEGADIVWDGLYRDQDFSKVNVPVYPLERIKYWAKPNTAGIEGLPINLKLSHSLLDRYLADNINHEVYLTQFSEKRHWVLRDHRILGHHLLPGTTYLEMAIESCKKYFPDTPVVLQDVVFIAPLVVSIGKSKEIQTVVRKENGIYEFTIGSKPAPDESWIIHARGKIRRADGKQPETPYHIGEIIAACHKETGKMDPNPSGGVFQFGPHWSSFGEVYFGEREAVLRLQLPEEFQDELNQYTLHPALLDNAVNFASQKMGEGVYLPFFYQKLTVNHALPGEFFSYVRLPKLTDNREIVTFNITLIDLSGKVIAEIENYTIKRIPQSEMDRLSVENEPRAGLEPQKDRLASDEWDIVLKGRDPGEEYTETEKSIGRIWGRLLQLDEINVYDSFSGLGGNSLFAVKMEAEMENHHIEVSMADIYEYTTIKELAAYIDHKKMNRDLPKPSLEESPLKNQDWTVEKSGRDDRPGHKRLDNVEPFNEVFYKQCFYNSLFPVIFHFDRNVYPFLANDIVTYGSDRDRNWVNSDISYLSAINLRQVLNFMGISVHTKRHGTSGEIDFAATGPEKKLIDCFMNDIGLFIDEENDIGNLVADIKRSISSHKPVIIWVDCFHESIRPDCYHKIHWPHTLLIYGYDDQEQCFDIIEHNHRENLTYQKRDIHYQDVLNSHRGFIEYYLSGEDFPTYYELELTDGADFSGDKDRHFSTYRANMLEKRESIYCGLKCLKEVIHEIKETLNNKITFKNYHEDVLYRINSIIAAKQVERYKNAGLLTGQLEIQNMVETTIELWTSIRNMIVKYAYLSTYDVNQFQSISSRLDQIYALECQYADSVFNLFGKHPEFSRA